MARPLLALAAYALLLLAVPGMAGLLLGGVIVARAHRWAERHKAEARAEAEATARGIEDRALALAEHALDVDRFSDAASRASGTPRRRTALPPRR